jgi:hypothetical protein
VGVFCGNAQNLAPPTSCHPGEGRGPSRDQRGELLLPNGRRDPMHQLCSVLGNRMPDYKSTRLYQTALVLPRKGSSSSEQEYFRTRLDAMRERTIPVVARVMRDMPGYTVHDITHLDALWETASLVADEAMTLNPPEAFVFGGAILLHDAAMTLAAYPGGVGEVQALPEWKDFLALQERNSSNAVDNGQILMEVLRTLHAKSAQRLATQAWESSTADINANPLREYLIEENDLRRFYGPSIGLIAHSHWWSVSRVEQELNRHLGPMPPITQNDVDFLKLAALLRVADATHLDRRRAPPFVRALDRPEGISKLHWQFQGRLGFPRLQHDALEFSAGEPCPVEEADSWWLGYDALLLADRELHDTDLMLREADRPGLRARRVKSISRASELASDIPVSGWKPVDTRVHVSDVPRVVATLGGNRLYGNDWWAPLRELLQNAVDSIEARRNLLKVPGWGSVLVRVETRSDGHWLVVEDDGVGMSERVLTTSLIDFGTSFWMSSAMAEEFPGLAASGLKPIGRFGIGFFSVFMLGDVVNVVSHRYDRAADSALKLSFSHGLASRPVLSPAEPGKAPKFGGTKVEIKLKGNPHESRNFEFVTDRVEETDFFSNLEREDFKFSSLDDLIEYLTPASEVTLRVGSDVSAARTVVDAGDWRTISAMALAKRTKRSAATLPSQIMEVLTLPIHDLTGSMVGRAALWPSFGVGDRGGVLTSQGFRIQAVPHLVGIVTGEVQTAARDRGSTALSPGALKEWGNDQSEILTRVALSSERKALCAEILLECGSHIYTLPIITKNEDWLNVDEFINEIIEEDEIALHLGSIDYDEEDFVSESSFDEFQPLDDLFIVPRLSGALMEATNRYRTRPSRLLSIIRMIIKETWGDYEEYDDEQVVGYVEHHEITRSVYIFKKQ